MYINISSVFTCLLINSQDLCSARNFSLKIEKCLHSTVGISLCSLIFGTDNTVLLCTTCSMKWSLPDSASSKGSEYCHIGDYFLQVGQSLFLWIDHMY